MSAALDWLRHQRRPSPASPRVGAPGKAGAAPADRRLPGEEIAPGLWRHRERRACLAPDTAIDLSRLMGASRKATREAWWRAIEAPIDPQRLRFFDTETTGLAGGTGTRAFMVGLARFDGDGLAITQYTTATMAAEGAMLEAMLADLAEAPILVSYNGRSFDRPLLSTRLKLARLPDPLAALPHLDLLHATRRRWRGVLPNCRLSTVERQWLGIVREHDLPGSEAPAAWMAYLRGGSAALLRRVGEHNAQDLASLAALLLKHFD